MPKRVIALGFFDGVHTGHGALLRCAAKQAQLLGVSPAVISFDPHPSVLLTGQSVGLLTTPAERQALIARLYQISDFLLLSFTEELMHMPWDDFVSTILVKQYEAVHLVCGASFRFGYQGEGNPERLAALCQSLGIGCSIVPDVFVDGTCVSSTRIRDLLQAGELSQANRLLGHPYSITGTVVHGQGLGHRYGFPTANFLFPETLLPPAFGVYACTAELETGSYWAVTNLGVKPTLGGSRSITVESWLLDYDGDLYGSQFRLQFHQFLRREQAFPSLDALREQILLDREAVQAYFLCQPAAEQKASVAPIHPVTLP